MSEVVMLRGAEPREILQAAIEKRIPAIMSYLSKGKWHVAKVLLTNLGANRLSVEVGPQSRHMGFERASSSTSQDGIPDASTGVGEGDSDLQKGRKMEPIKPHPVNIQVNQPVGISLKYGYGKFVFDTSVEGLEPSTDSTTGGTIVLAVPDKVEIVQRRSYFRVDVPRSLKVNVLLWHRRRNRGAKSEKRDTKDEIRNYWQGRLVDISAGGAQIVVDNGVPQHALSGLGPPVQRPEDSQFTKDRETEAPDFKKGQFIGLRFTPMPYETPLMFDAQIRNILPTADGKSNCLGLQIVGLEASVEGRQVLQRLCNVVERYYQINQSSAKQQDMQPMGRSI
jgi:hypothetical protein